MPNVVTRDFAYYRELPPDQALYELRQIEAAALRDCDWDIAAAALQLILAIVKEQK